MAALPSSGWVCPYKPRRALQALAVQPWAGRRHGFTSPARRQGRAAAQTAFKHLTSCPRGCGVAAASRALPPAPPPALAHPTASNPPPLPSPPPLQELAAAGHPPVVLQDCLRWLALRGLTAPHLFAGPAAGDKRKLLALRHLYDTGRRPLRSKSCRDKDPHLVRRLGGVCCRHAQRQAAGAVFRVAAALHPSAVSHPTSPSLPVPPTAAAQLLPSALLLQALHCRRTCC